jgi:large subunit ribosomal protein L9
MSQVILKENIRRLGRIGDVVSVRDGYAFNYLIPLNKAIPATKENLKSLESQKELMIKEDQKHKEVASKIAEKIPTQIFLTREINENSVLYGSITAKDILEVVPQITDKHAIHFKNHHIHTYGIYPVDIELHHDVIVSVTLSIADTIESAKKQLQESTKKHKSVNKKSSDKEQNPEESDI